MGTTGGVTEGIRSYQSIINTNINTNTIINTNINTSINRPIINIMLLYSTEGSYSNTSNFRLISPVWGESINEKYLADSTWPFNVVLVSIF